MNWDMQGYLYDYLTVEFSIDGGNSWTPISGNYGIPGTGVWYNGRLYYGETNGWIPMYMPLQYNFSSSQAINFTLLKFSAITNPYVNYGGTSSSGWEGVAIDSIVFHEKRGTQNANSLLFNDFNTQPNTGLYSPDGWLTTSSSTFNQWQWTDTMGLNSRKLKPLISIKDSISLLVGLCGLLMRMAGNLVRHQLPPCTVRKDSTQAQMAWVLL